MTSSAKEQETAAPARPVLSGDTLGVVLSEAAAWLQGAGVDSPRRDARLLLANALEVPLARVLGYPETPVGREMRDRVASLVARRAAREPVSRILGRREFWGLSFRITRDTLDPRPDSETLVEAVLRETPDRARPLRVLDLGTGTGCLLLALLSELPNARGVGVDLSFAAARTAERNACALGLAGRAAFICGSWCDSLAERRGPAADLSGWDLIVSKPALCGDGGARPSRPGGCQLRSRPCLVCRPGRVVRLPAPDSRGFGAPRPWWSSCAGGRRRPGGNGGGPAAERGLDGAGKGPRSRRLRALLSGTPRQTAARKSRQKKGWKGPGSRLRSNQAVGFGVPKGPPHDPLKSVRGAQLAEPP